MSEQTPRVSTTSLMTETRAFPPSQNVIERAHLKDGQYKEMYDRSIRDPEGFWLDQAGTLDWFRKPTRALNYEWNTGARKVKHTWFEDGQINVTANVGSTGFVAERIARTLLDRGHEAIVAYGRTERPGAGLRVKIGSPRSTLAHGIRSLLDDGQGLGSRSATQTFVKTLEREAPDLLVLHNLDDLMLVLGGPLLEKLGLLCHVLLISRNTRV